MADLGTDIHGCPDRVGVKEPDSDLLRGMVSSFIKVLMSVKVNGLCGAGYRERSETQANKRNAYRRRDFDTRVANCRLRSPNSGPSGSGLLPGMPA